MDGGATVPLAGAFNRGDRVGRATQAVTAIEQLKRAAWCRPAWWWEDAVMSEYPESFDHMLAAWNENDPARVRGHLERALAADIEFIDPSIELHGIDEFEANVHEVHGQIPGATYSRTSGVDSHHRWYRYSWEIRRDGELILSGFDSAEVGEHGKVRRVIGYFGPLPELG